MSSNTSSVSFETIDSTLNYEIPVDISPVDSSHPVKSIWTDGTYIYIKSANNITKRIALSSF